MIQGGTGSKYVSDSRTPSITWLGNQVYARDTTTAPMIPCLMRTRDVIVRSNLSPRGNSKRRGSNKRRARIGVTCAQLGPGRETRQMAGMTGGRHSGAR
jgi:hypothetical protein